MATTPTDPTASAYGRASASDELQRARDRTLEHLQQASDEIDKARQEATGGVRRGLDSALEHLREARGELRQRAQVRATEWQVGLEQAPDKVRREMGRRAIRAQQTPEALTELSAEIRKREADLSAPTKVGGSTAR
jgi:hypothetical protein